jgi:hypothetical protein
MVDMNPSFSGDDDDAPDLSEEELSDGSDNGVNHDSVRNELEDEDGPVMEDEEGAEGLQTITKMHLGNNPGLKYMICADREDDTQLLQYKNMYRRPGLPTLIRCQGTTTSHYSNKESFYRQCKNTVANTAKEKYNTRHTINFFNDTDKIDMLKTNNIWKKEYAICKLHKHSTAIPFEFITGTGAEGMKCNMSMVDTSLHYILHYLEDAEDADSTTSTSMADMISHLGVLMKGLTNVIPDITVNTLMEVLVQLKTNNKNRSKTKHETDENVDAMREQLVKMSTILSSIGGDTGKGRERVSLHVNDFAFRKGENENPEIPKDEPDSDSDDDDMEVEDVKDIVVNIGNIINGNKRKPDSLRNGRNSKKKRTTR